MHRRWRQMRRSGPRHRLARSSKASLSWEALLVVLAIQEARNIERLATEIRTGLVAIDLRPRGAASNARHALEQGPAGPCRGLRLVDRFLVNTRSRLVILVGRRSD